MIQDVIVKPLRLMPDERGWLMEILRNDDPDLFIQFGQVYVTVGYPGVVKAWHCHEKQVDHFTVLNGMAKIVLHDGREDSPTYKETNEFFFGEHNRSILRIPPRVWHGFKAIGGREAMIMNCPTEVYRYDKPDELRLPPHDGSIDYDWSQKDG